MHRQLLKTHHAKLKQGEAAASANKQAKENKAPPEKKAPKGKKASAAPKEKREPRETADKVTGWCLTTKALTCKNCCHKGMLCLVL